MANKTERQNKDNNGQNCVLTYIQANHLFRLKTVRSPVFSGCHSEKKTSRIITCLQLNKNSSSYILLTIHGTENSTSEENLVQKYPDRSCIKSRLAFSGVFRLELTDYASVAELKGVTSN
jgi:hypothetical protein